MWHRPKEIRSDSQTGPLGGGGAGWLRLVDQPRSAGGASVVRYGEGSTVAEQADQPSLQLIFCRRCDSPT